MKVLIVEDDEAILHIARMVLEHEGAEVITASTLADARQAFHDHPDLEIISLDGFLRNYHTEEEEPDTKPLAEEFSRTFTGWLVAASTDPEINRQLWRAGCNHICRYKKDLPQQLVQLMHTPPRTKAAG